MKNDEFENDGYEDSDETYGEGENDPQPDNEFWKNHVKEGEFVENQITLERIIPLKLYQNNKNKTTRIDIGWCLRIDVTEKKFYRYELGVGTYVIPGLFEAEDLNGYSGPRKLIAGITPQEALEKAEEVVRNIKPGAHPVAALRGWKMYEIE